MFETLDDIRNFFAKAYQHLWSSPTEDWIFYQFAPEQLKDISNSASSAVVPNNAYLTVKLRSMRITKVRKGLRRFYPVVNSFISLTHRGGKLAEFPVVTTPKNLKMIDENNVDRVLQMDQTLLDQGAYRGNAIGVEIGLFSVEFTDLADGYISLLTRLASLGGVQYFNVALPFVEPIRYGMQLLTRTQGNTILEIGLKRDFSPPRTGWFLVMRAEKDTVDPSTLRVDPSDFKVTNATGNLVKDFPYLVFSVSSSNQRDDWFSIPEISGAYNNLKEKVLAGKNDRIQEALAHFRIVTMWNDDLIAADADKIVKIVETKVADIRGDREASADSLQMPDLQSLQIY